MKITDVAVAEKFNDMIIYMLAHDLRQPFASLIELADMVMKSGRVFTDDELCRIFENVDSTSSISLEILNGLLCRCKINKEGVEFESKALLLNRAIAEANSLYVQQQVSRNILIQNHILRDQLIYAPKEILQFINRNILSNATKHSPQGGIMDISCSTTDEYITVAFRARGRGLSQQQLKMLFNVNETDLNDSGNAKGAGIAMSICRDMISKLYGRIWAKSIKEKGTIFYYTIPNQA